MFLGIYRFMADVDYAYNYLKGHDANIERRKLWNKFCIPTEPPDQGFPVFTTTAYLDIRQNPITIQICGGANEFQSDDERRRGVDIVCMDIPCLISVCDDGLYNFYKDLYCHRTTSSYKESIQQYLEVS